MLADDGASDDSLGRSVAINGQTIVAGARTDGAGADSGSAYVFVETTVPDVPSVSHSAQLSLAVAFAGLLAWRLTRPAASRRRV